MFDVELYWLLIVYCKRTERKSSRNSGDSASTAAAGDRQRSPGGAGRIRDDHVTGIDIRLPS